MQYLHNPRCSKSRQGLDLLEKNNITFEIRLYLKEPLNKAEIEKLVNALDISDAKSMMRTKEDEFRQQNLSEASQDALILAMVTTPKLIERPILINGDKAAIGRPPENLLGII